MVDQMRWDFLYRYADRYGNDGFKRMLREGFTCENALIPYAQTVTACGHSTVYTGTTPALSGIYSNEWYDSQTGKTIYCAEDPSVEILGGGSRARPMSPRNMKVTTVSDELRIATNYRSKVIGIAIKDRGGILPAGHAANAAYWYDSQNGNWVSSTYYMEALPGWVNRFNARKLPDSLFGLNWNTLYPIQTYVQSDADEKSYEGKMAGAAKPVFPHQLEGYIGKNYGAVAATPHGNTLTLEFAKQAIQAEKMGADEIPDLLAVSLSSPDYIGHQYGPNSIEIEDSYLRLDKELASFFKFLDARFGKNYTVFLTADHGVAHVPEYGAEHKLPGGRRTSNFSAFKLAEEKFGVKNLVVNSSNYQVYLNHKLMDSLKIDVQAVKSFLIQELKKEPTLHTAFDNADLANAPLPAEVKEKFVKGYHPKYSGDIQLVPLSGFIGSGSTGTTHGSWYNYDAHIPMVFMGWGIKSGKTHRETYMTDFAPTIAALLKIQMPSASIGHVVTEVLK
jgi:predicted AlkP superfamily pyrophosphatase or phosphodiesterase